LPIITKKASGGGGVTDYNTNVDHSQYPLAIVSIFVPLDASPNATYIPFKDPDGRWHVRTPDGFSEIAVSFFHRGITA